MKKVWMGLSIASALIGVIGTAADMMSGSSFDDAGVMLLFFGLLTIFFAWLAWLWRIRSPIKRTAEQLGAMADTVKANSKVNRALPKPLKRRMWKYRIIGTAVAIVGVWTWLAGNWSIFWIAIGTVVLIAGIGIFMMGSPSDYNSATDAMLMIGFDRSQSIEDICRAFSEIQTPLGSAWMGRFRSSPYDSMIFGPDTRGQFIYFYLNGSGDTGYIGYSFMKNIISKRLSEPDYPPKEDLGADTAGHLCYHTDVFFFKDWLKESIEQYTRTGQPMPFRASIPSDIYTFTENFKLTGQNFEVRDAYQNTVYIVDGTVPLISLRIFDIDEHEIFRMTKEIGHALATYRFFYKGEPYGVLEKQFTFVRDKFTMNTKDGKLELIEYAGTVGHNFRVMLNDRLIGAIMDNMDITIKNVMWDNAFLIVYEKEYLALVTAMAVMVTRELARDEDGGLTNRTGGVTDIV